MPCVTPLMVGTRRRRPSRCRPGSEEPARSWDEWHLPSQGPLGLGECDAVVVPSEWRVPHIALHSARTGRQQPWPRCRAQIQLSITWGKGLGQRMGMERGVSAVRVALPSPHPAGGTVPAQRHCRRLPCLPLPEAQTTPQLHLRGPQPHNHVLADPRALHVGVRPEQPVCPADPPPPLCSWQE